MDIKHLKNDEVVLDFKYFNMLRVYDLFNPHIPKIFGWNRYQLFCIVFSVFSIVVFAYATIGLFIDLEDKLDEVEIVLTVTIHMEHVSCLVKLVVFIYYSDSVWNLFNVFRVDFLTSDSCRKHAGILHETRARSSRFIVAYIYIALLLIQQWGTFPYTYNKFIGFEGPNHRLMNIFNLRFPISTDVYNEYYVLFYIIEFLIALHLSMFFFLGDIMLISFSWIMIVQHDVLAQSFQEIGHGKDEQTEEDYEKLKSIIFDQQQLFVKLKVFHNIAKPILFVYIAVDSTVIVLDSYTFVLICTTDEAVSLPAILKMSFTLFYVYCKLFVHCYSFDEMNSKRESVTFGIYSCNWTIMDLNFRKTVLLAMRMNDINQIIIKFSPIKIINMQMFSGIISTSFNMISVLLNTMGNKSAE